MRLIGWCRICRKVKYVNVEAIGPPAVGRCDDCEEKS